MHTRSRILLAFALALLPAIAAAQTVSTVYNFSGTDGSFPQPQVLAQGRDGMLYGTTFRGGASGSDGTIFKFDPSTSQLTTLYSFTDFTDGELPAGGLTLATDGNFYGTAPAGGTNGKGVLFRISPAGVYTVLYNFTGATDGDYPVTAPVETENGVLYGMSGGEGGSGPYVSALYKFMISSGEFSAVYTLPSDLGNAGLAPVQIANGDFYISTTFIAPNGCGSILRVTPAGVLKSTYIFASCAAKQGADPGWMVAAEDGNVYGTAFEGGSQWVGGGTIFKDDPKTSILSVMHDFGSVPDDGIYPTGLMQATDGNFYGATEQGGSAEFGTLFQWAPGGLYNVLYSFPGNPEGPVSPSLPSQYTTGMFFGTTFYDGSSNNGTIYSLDMGLGPFVSLVCNRGTVGQTIQILGQNLAGATSVTVNGTPASFQVVSETFMTAVIPADATTGSVVVTTPSGTLTSSHTLQIVE
jgi:uncharacterized repeat protein (TIGR03803 family)